MVSWSRAALQSTVELGEKRKKKILTSFILVSTNTLMHAWNDPWDVSTYCYNSSCWWCNATIFVVNNRKRKHMAAILFFIQRYGNCTFVHNTDILIEWTFIVFTQFIPSVLFDTFILKSFLCSHLLQTQTSPNKNRRQNAIICKRTAFCTVFLM